MGHSGKLACESRLDESVIVGQSRRNGRIGRKRDGRERRPIRTQPTHELGDQMEGVGGAAAIAEKDGFATIMQRRGDFARCGRQRLGGCVRSTLDQKVIVGRRPLD